MTARRDFLKHLGFVTAQSSTTSKIEPVMTEEQKVQELLKPRYIVTNKWPGCPYKVGDILYEDDTVHSKYYRLQDDPANTNIFYPDLFKANLRKLEWWEERNASEMPEYYKYSGTHGIYRTQFQPNGDTIMLDFKPTETVPCKLSDCLPATSAEYTAYIEKQPTTQNQGV